MFLLDQFLEGFLFFQFGDLHVDEVKLFATVGVGAVVGEHGEVLEVLLVADELKLLVGLSV